MSLRQNYFRRYQSNCFYSEFRNGQNREMSKLISEAKSKMAILQNGLKSPNISKKSLHEGIWTKKGTEHVFLKLYILPQNLLISQNCDQKLTKTLLEANSICICTNLGKYDHHLAIFLSFRAQNRVWRNKSSFQLNNLFSLFLRK